jgi:hypothetical protein
MARSRKALNQARIRYAHIYAGRGYVLGRADDAFSTALANTQANKRRTKPLDPSLPCYGRERIKHRPACASSPWKSKGECDCGAQAAAEQGNCSHGKSFDEECPACNRQGRRA